MAARTLRVTARAVILDSAGRGFAVRHRERDPAMQGKWATPGGGLEARDADPVAGLLRELSEEFGSAAVARMEVGPQIAESLLPGRQDHFFLVRYPGVVADDLVPVDDREIVGHGWFGPAQLAAMDFYFGFESEIFVEAAKLAAPSRYDRRANIVPLPLLRLREWATAHAPGPPPWRLVLLGGGFSNSNYKIVFDDGTCALLRIEQLGKSTAAREIAILTRLRSSPVNVPRVRAAKLMSEPAWILMDFVPGTNLHELIATNALAPADWRAIGYAVAEQLAEIHAIEFAASGFFNEHFRFDFTFESVGAAYLDYIRESLTEPAFRRRCGEALADRLAAALERWEADFLAVRPGGRLAHADFNPKNLLVERVGDENWRVSAVLDWEFVLAAAPQGDAGNFLRFEHEMPAPLTEAFRERFARSAPVANNPGWRREARLLDLTALCGFLRGADERPRAERTARELIEKTIDEL